MKEKNLSQFKYALENYTLKSGIQVPIKNFIFLEDSIEVIFNNFKVLIDKKHFWKWYKSFERDRLKILINELVRNIK